MSDSKIRELQKILTEIDRLLRERLRTAGLDIRHVLLAIAPDGAGVVRGNVGLDDLADLAEVLADVAADTAPPAAGGRAAALTAPSGPNQQ